MGSYTVVAEAGNALVRLLRRELVPEIIRSADAIGLATPADKGDLVLCVHMYDVSESMEYRMSTMVSDGVSRQKYPPVYLTLSYMITVFSSSDVKFRSEEEQRIMGRVMQVLRDFSVLNTETMEFSEGGGGEGIRMEMRKMELDEKIRLWNFPNLAIKPSLYYKLGPIMLESAKTKAIQRVGSVEFRTEE